MKSPMLAANRYNLKIVLFLILKLLSFIIVSTNYDLSILSAGYHWSRFIKTMTLTIVSFSAIVITNIKSLNWSAAYRPHSPKLHISTSNKYK